MRSGAVPQKSPHALKALYSYAGQKFNESKENKNTAQSQNAQKKDEQNRKDKQKRMIDSAITQQLKIKSLLDAKKITSEQARERLARIEQPRLEHQRIILPANLHGKEREEYLKRHGGAIYETDEDYNVEKARAQRVREADKVRNPISIMPMGTQKARKNIKTGEYDNRLTPRESERLGEQGYERVKGEGDNEPVLVEVAKDDKGDYRPKTLYEKLEDQKREAEANKSKTDDLSDLSANERLSLVLAGAR